MFLVQWLIHTQTMSPWNHGQMMNTCSKLPTLSTLSMFLIKLGPLHKYIGCSRIKFFMNKVCMSSYNFWLKKTTIQFPHKGIRQYYKFQTNITLSDPSVINSEYYWSKMGMGTLRVVCGDWGSVKESSCSPWKKDLHYRFKTRWHWFGYNDLKNLLIWSEILHQEI